MSSFTFLQLVALVSSLSFFTSTAWAAPVAQRDFLGDLGSALSGLGSSSDGTVALAAADLTTDFSRAAQFSRAVYCSPDSVTTSTCGPACDALGADTTFLLSGGGESLYLAGRRSDN